VDSTTGEVYQPSINAEATMTLALPKSGLVSENAAFSVGDLYLADISVPLALYRSMELDIPNIFIENEIIKIS
jgi:NAD(P)H-hydrate epimerase